jgi:hypothetical protein
MIMENSGETMMFKRRHDSHDLERRIAELEVAALQSTVPGAGAGPLNQAGDLLLAAGDIRGAVELYGRAIDSLVEADRFEAGMALCKKIIRTVPHVVRARCTLTWLAIGAGFTAEAAARVSDYVTAAELAGREAMAQLHVRHMGEVAEMHELRIILGECLLYLGDDVAANDMFGEVFAERNAGGQREIPMEQRWQDVRAAALLGPRRFPNAF